MLLSNNNIFITQQDRENNTSQYILEAINIAHNIITKPDITGSYSLRQNDSDVVNYSKCT